MKIKKLFETPTLPYHMVLETLDGRYMCFGISPVRQLTERDLEPLPGYQAKGNNAKEAAWYFYQLFGLEKEGEN